MRKLAVLIAACALAAGCSGDGGDGAPPVPTGSVAPTGAATPTPAATASASPDPVAGGTVTRTGPLVVLPSVADERWTAFVAEVGGAVPALADDRQAAVAGQLACLSLLNEPGDRPATLANVRRALAGGGITVDDTEATAVLDAAHEHLCPAAGD